MGERGYLTLELVDNESIRLDRSILKYIAVLESVYDEGEVTLLEEDKDFQLEWPLWNLVKEILIEYDTRREGIDRITGLVKAKLLEEVQLYDLYRLLRVMYHYDSSAMIHLLLQHLVERLLALDTASLVLMNPRLGSEPEKGLTDDLITPLEEISEDYSVKRELLMLIFTYYIETYDLLEILENRYLPEVTSVLASGSNHTAVITQSGLLVKGDNTYGQLGLGVEDVSSNRWYTNPLTTTDDVVIISVWCGAQHTMISTNKGLFACGDNEYGQLGLTDRLLTGKRVFTPTKVILPQVLSVACGVHHTLFLTVDGVFGCGRNNYGQLGLPISLRVFVPLIVDLEEGPIIAVACGNHYSLLLSASGNVYHSGLALQGVPANTQRFTRLALPEKIEKIYAGARHAIMINAAKEVYVLGANIEGQLGLNGKAQWQTTAIKHPSLKGIVDAAACDDWSMFINEEGDLFATGANEYNQLGFVGSSTTVPVKVAAMSNVISVACASRSTSILTCEGLFTTGGSSIRKEEIVKVASKRPICKRRPLQIGLHCHVCGVNEHEKLLLNNVTQQIVCSYQCQSQYRQFRV